MSTRKTRAQRRAGRQAAHLLHIEHLLEQLQKAERAASTSKLVVQRFLGGIAQGLGSMIGFSLLGALLAFLLTTAVRDELPRIALWLEKMLESIQKRL